MSKPSSYSPRKAAKAALGSHGFVPHTRDLLASAAWRTRSLHATRVLDCLELEHLSHAGKENGYLILIYDQFVAYGIPRQYIKPAIKENVARGLLSITHQGGFSGAAKNDPSTYRLTYLASKFLPAAGPPQYFDPTDEWKSFAGDLRKPRKEKRSSGDITDRLRKNGIKPNGHDLSHPHQERKMSATKRRRERERYLKTNAPRYGENGAAERWAAYEKLIVGRYGADDLDEAWKARDRAHQPWH
jgi:hypothetical protein